MNKPIRFLSTALAATALAALTACGTTDPYGPNNYPVSQLNPPPVAYSGPGPYYSGPYSYSGAAPAYGTTPYQAPASVEFGRVTNIQLVKAGTGVSAPNRSAAGGVIGAIVGGLLGNQIGSGGGRAAATVLGATAGAVVGSNVGQGTTYNAEYPVYRVTVQTDAGQWRTYDVNATGELRPGDRVRIENGVIYLA